MGLSVRTTPELQEAIRREAEIQGVKVSDYVRESVNPQTTTVTVTVTVSDANGIQTQPIQSRRFPSWAAAVEYRQQLHRQMRHPQS